MQDGAGKAEQLALARREVIAALPDFFVETVLELVDEVVMWFLDNKSKK